MDRRVLAAFAVAVMVGAGCGSAKTSSTQPSATSPSGTAASSTASPAAVETPTSTTNSFGDILPPAGPVAAASAALVGEIACSGAIGPSDPVAIVTLHSGGQALRDYADSLHPRTACTFPTGLYGFALIDAHHVVVGGEANLYAIVELPSVSHRWFQLPNPSGQFPDFVAVSPALDEVVYLSADMTDNTDKVHLATKSGDQVVASLPNPHGGRCGSPEDSKNGAFTHSGAHLFVLDQPIPSLNSLVVLQDGKPLLQLKPPGQIPTSSWPQGAQPAMAVWSPTSEVLYYRQGADVWRWTAARGAQRFLAGVAWYYPTISPDGGHLAYAVVRPDGLHNVYLVDLVHGGSPQLIGNGARNLPAFLNSSQLWYRSEGQGICGPGGNQPLVYDLSDGSEAPSIVDFVGSVWPATSSNF